MTQVLNTSRETKTREPLVIAFAEAQRDVLDIKQDLKDAEATLSAAKKKLLRKYVRPGIYTHRTTGDSIVICTKTSTSRAYKNVVDDIRLHIERFTSGNVQDALMRALDESLAENVGVETESRDVKLLGE